MTREEIYAQITGSGESYVENEFEPGGACMEAYGEVYKARERLAERTGIDFEDEDVMTIIRNMEEIARICSYKMYDYALMNANKTQE